MLLSSGNRWERRRFLCAGAALAAGALAGCAHEDGDAFDGPPPGGPQEVYEAPSGRLSGALRILVWSHFVSSHDLWFDRFASRWGRRAGVEVTVDHIDLAQIPTRVAAEVHAEQGHDLIQYVAPLPQFEPAVLDLTDVVVEACLRWGPQLELCRRSSFNPATGRFFAYSPGWVPDPGNYRRSLWSAAGLPAGPSTWDELLLGGSQIRRSTGLQLGLGMSQELDSNMVGRALLWSYGAAVQDAAGRVALKSSGATAAVEFMARLFRQAMTDGVFAWTAASNNQGLVAGQLSYITNSISAWRTAQRSTPAVAADTDFVPALRGPVAGLAAPHLVYNWIIPRYAGGAAAAQEFLLHYTANYAAATYASKLYDLCAWPSLTPDLTIWLGRDPFRAQPPDKLALLAEASRWSVDVGHPGSENAAIGEVMTSFIIPAMFARAARRGRGADPPDLRQVARERAGRLMGTHGVAMRPRHRVGDRESLLARLFVLPAIGYVLALIGLPVGLAVAYALSDMTVGDLSYDWVGMANIAAVLDDPVFWASLGHSLFFTAVSTVLAIAGGHLVARLMLARVHGRWLVRLCALLPWTTPVTLSAVAWLWLFDPLFSPMDWAGRQIGVLGPAESVNWLGRPHLAMAAVVAVQAWRLTPLRRSSSWPPWRGFRAVSTKRPNSTARADGAVPSSSPCR